MRTPRIIVAAAVLLAIAIVAGKAAGSFDSKDALVVSKEPSGFHTRYNKRADLGRIAMQKPTIDVPVERLTFAIEAAPSGGGRIAMLWETTRAWVPFTVVR